MCMAIHCARVRYTKDKFSSIKSPDPLISWSY